MSIGNTGLLSLASLNTTIGDLATRKRNLEHDVIEFAQIVNQQGSAGLQAVGLAPADATNFINAVNHLLTNAQIYFGLTNQPANFNFDGTTDLIEARGGAIQ